MLDQTSWRPSKVVGLVLFFFGCFPFIVWLLHNLGFLLPERGEIGDWSMLVVTAGMVGLGWMLYNGKGESISDAFLSWFKKKGA